MAVKDTIQSIKNNVANAYTKLQDKGATIPTNKNIENLASTIDTVTGGGITPSGTLLIQTNGKYDVTSYAEADVNVSVPTEPIEPPILTTKTITENGTYNASDDNADGYASVTVNVAGSGGEGITDGLAKMLSGEATELVPSDFGNITKLGYFALKSTVNVTKITFPDTITKFGERVFYQNAGLKEVHLNGAGLHNVKGVFYEARALENINNGELNFDSSYGEGLFYLCDKLNNIKINHTVSAVDFLFPYMFYQFGLNSKGGSTKPEDYTAEYTLKGIATTGTQMSFEYTCYQAKMKKYEIADLTYVGKSGGTANYMFQSCYIDEVSFPKAKSCYSGSSAKRMFYNSNINRLKVPSLSSTNSMFYGNNYIKKIFFGDNCALGGTTALYIPDTSKNFIPHTAIDTYSQGTNWTTLFANGGAEETRMFVYNNFTSGDTLPTQIGTTQVYNVTWYEDDDFTTLASGTATSDKEYYGKISAVV